MADDKDKDKKPDSPPAPPTPPAIPKPEVGGRKTAFLPGEPTRDWREPEKYAKLKPGDASKIMAEELKAAKARAAKRKKHFAN